MNSRSRFMHNTDELISSPSTRRIKLWSNHLYYVLHITKVKAKTAARSNVIKKLSTSKCGANPAAIRITTPALSYSSAENTCPVWKRSAQAHTINPLLNDACRSITGCLQLVSTCRYRSPSYKEKCCSTKREGVQVNDTRHPLHDHTVPKIHMK